MILIYGVPSGFSVEYFFVLRIFCAKKRKVTASKDAPEFIKDAYHAPDKAIA